MSRIRITPDGARYLADTPPSPFHLRPLLPLLCRRDPCRWKIATYLGIALTALGTWALVGGWQGIAAALILASLPSTRYNATHPVLIDAMALGLATCAAAATVHGQPMLAAILVLLAAATKESAPIFAALFAWNPLLLAGLIVPAIIASLRTPGQDVLNDEHAAILAHPIQAGREYHRRFLIDGSPALFTPWGGAIVALGAPSLQLFATLAAGYGQLLIATDTTRLYQWAAPVVCIAATTALGPQWWPLLIIATWFNPLRGDGV